MFLFLLLNILLAQTPSTPRIVSLNPALTEILFKLDLGNHIVGTTTYSDYPEAAKKIPIIGSYFKPNIEKIIKLSPTHVLAYKEGDPSILKFLEKSKIPFYVFESRTENDFLQTLEKLGNLFSKKSQVDVIVQNWYTTFQKIPAHKPFTGLIQLDYNPLIAAGSDTFLSEALEKCGLKNIFTFTGYKKINAESVSAKRPDKIIVIGQLNAHTQFKDVQKYWSNNKITHSSQVILADANTLSRLGPRFPEGVRALCEELK